VKDLSVEINYEEKSFLGVKEYNFYDVFFLNLSLELI